MGQATFVKHLYAVWFFGLLIVLLLVLSLIWLVPNQVLMTLQAHLDSVKRAIQPVAQSITQFTHTRRHALSADTINLRAASACSQPASECNS